MKSKLMEILACPVCRHHPLELAIDKKESEEIITGTIKCSKCGNTYPIQDAIPNMLPPELR